MLLGAGLIPLSFSGGLPELRLAVFLFDLFLIGLAIGDGLFSRSKINGLSLTRMIPERMPIGEASTVTLQFENRSRSSMTIKVKDEHPPEMKLSEPRESRFILRPAATACFEYRLTPPKRGVFEFGGTAVRVLSRLGLVWCQAKLGDSSVAKVYPSVRRGREIELQALGAQSFVAVQRQAVRRGEGREFESMRDYVRGDEMRHISWTATARRSKLTTRQYQIERDQNIIIALDAGRLMTGRIDDETKFETALHAAIALMGTAVRAGDNFGLLVFGRRVEGYLPPKKGMGHLDAALKLLHNAEPQLIESSYARAFKFISANVKKRSFVVILTDLVDKDSSSELIHSLKLLRPRHLPLVAAIADRDLRSTVNEMPENVRELFIQSAAEEIIHQRGSALRMVETLGGLALDVTSRTLAPKLLESYLKVKERGLI